MWRRQHDVATLAGVVALASHLLPVSVVGVAGAVVAESSASKANVPSTKLKAASASVAICIVGLLHRISQDRDGYRSAAETLGADVFVVLTANGKAGDPYHLAELSVTGARIVADPGRQGLREEALRLDPSGRVLKRLAKWPGAQFAQPLSTPEAPDADTAVYQLLDMARCYADVRAREADRGFAYRYVVYARADVHWLAPPPPVELLERVDPAAVWIPDGCDSDGINDRMALVPRRWAGLYFDRWGLLVNGSLFPLLRRASGAGFGRERGPEWMLYVVLRGNRVPVLRFSPVCAIICVQHNTKQRNGACTRTVTLGNDRVQFKYSQEGNEAMKTAVWLSKSWNWRPGHMPWFHPGCFQSVDEKVGCCDDFVSGWGGHAECWDDVFFYWRCCGSAAGVVSWPWRRDSGSHNVKVHGLFVLPSSALARHHVQEGAASLCWQVTEMATRCIDNVALAAEHWNVSVPLGLLRL